MRGDEAAAEDTWQRLSALDRPGGPRPAAAMAILSLARGDLAGAQHSLSERHSAWRIHAISILYAASDTMLAARRWSEALAAADEAQRHAEHNDLPFLAAAAERAHGMVSIHTGDLPGAATALQRAADGFAALHHPWEEGRSQTLLSRVLEEIGRTADAAAARRRGSDLRLRLGIVSDPLIDRFELH
jgi:RES domain-containing protein